MNFLHPQLTLVEGTASTSWLNAKNWSEIPGMTEDNDELLGAREPDEPDSDAEANWLPIGNEAVGWKVYNELNAAAAAEFVALERAVGEDDTSRGGPELTVWGEVLDLGWNALCGASPGPRVEGGVIRNGLEASEVTNGWLLWCILLLFALADDELLVTGSRKPPLPFIGILKMSALLFEWDAREEEDFATTWFGRVLSLVACKPVVCLGVYESTPFLGTGGRRCSALGGGEFFVVFWAKVGKLPEDCIADKKLCSSSTDSPAGEDVGSTAG